MKNAVLKDLALLAIRIGAGAMMLTHGIPKIGRFFGEGPVKFADPFGLGPEISLGMAIFAEVICAVLVMIGFKTRLATIPLILTMLTAAFYAHWNDPFGKKELPLLYVCVFLGILAFGAGKFAVDSFLKKKKLF
ncbi:putative oxidoreductase [Algoriphagus alkaliphilus]|uniref:Putative oxidoreductase n=1 Tax=Algoriphagus alkaliphilus TaxID=279824 RepID=A0A1G5YA97_9BACT|nr:DoxX family protein [Algoriphagus alkaliphilus]MBA4299594.1 DoxX family protein [Cyclobacterium sp.]SDA79601.1 putative oxidoreductase [Algoriphagus alkaliphilus]